MYVYSTHLKSALKRSSKWLRLQTYDDFVSPPDLSLARDNHVAVDVGIKEPEE